jgi:NACalpha-BTF3-like transcription factor
MSDVTLDLVGHTSASSLDALQDRLAFDSDHALQERYHVVDQDEVERQKADLHDTLQLPGIHTHPHPQEPYYTHDSSLQGLPYNLPLGLQFQYLPQPHLGLPSLAISDVGSFGSQQDLLQLQQLNSPLPENHDPGHSLVSSVRIAKLPRKSRWRPTPKQKERLEAFWVEDQYPDRKKKQLIASELEAVSAEQVSRWFKHRRESLAQKGQFAYRSEAAAKFSNDQVITLEQVFKSNAYPSREDIKLISEQMVVSQQRVKNWFKARRCRLAQKGEFEFRQNDVQVRPQRPMMNERLKRSKDEISVMEPHAKRQELMPGLPEDIVDVVEESHHHHHHHHDHQEQDHTDLPHISALVPDVDMSGSLHSPLVEHIMPKSEHEDVDHVFHSQSHHLLHDIHRVTSIKDLHHLEDVVHT